ncbi:S-adenosyl-L-methionine-dependent methyltransferase [Baffinella frigidus]|nr:S-adenosyl-L-methionine-dependent methyltransferase [Cryptophyta sp. CCMP2293]
MAAPPSAETMVKAASSEWDECAGTWDTMAGPTSHWAHDSHEKVMKLVKGKPGIKRVLDFGAGTGVLGLALRTSLEAQGVEEVVFHDVAPKMLEEISKKIAAEGLTKTTVSPFTGNVAEAASTDLAAPFDLIVSGSVLTFVPDAHATISALRERLTPGTGVMVHFVHQYTPPEKDESFSASVANQAQYYSGFTHEDIQKVMQVEGLTEVAIEEFALRMSSSGEEGDTAPEPWKMWVASARRA